jgi:hydroxycarboxylate dehydrogenase B
LDDDHTHLYVMGSSGEGLRVFEADRLVQVGETLLVAAGSPPSVAERVTALLVQSERMGHSSHGVLRIPSYVGQITQGRLVPTAETVIVADNTTTTVMDGGWGFGQISALDATEHSIARARSSGTSVTGVYHINHVGRLGDFTEMAARAGMVAFAFSGGAPTGSTGNVAPFGGRQAVWGTNPLAIAIPATDRVFSLDFATSVIAWGKAAAARARGVQLEGEFLLDAAGRPTRDPWVLEQGGAIRPFGEHKGYALAFAIELLAGALVSAAAPDLADGEIHNGLLLFVLDPAALSPRDRFHAAVAAIFEKVKASPPADGFDEVMIPGEPELRSVAAAASDGITVPQAVVDELTRLGSTLGVNVEW